MTAAPILVTGATGRLGRLIVERLLARGQPVRVYARRPEVAKALFGQRVQMAAGAFENTDALEKALCGVEHLLLLSPISAELASQQIAVADRAVAAGVKRIVKISGSNWTIGTGGRSISGDAHAAIETHLQSLAIPSVSLRPNAWMQVSLANTIRRVLAHQPILAANADAGIGYIDARDIADLAAQQLSAETVSGPVLDLSGPASVTPHRIAALLSERIGRPVPITPPPAFSASSDFEHRAIGEFAALIAEGRAAYTTPTISDLLGHSPRSVENFISETVTDAALAEG
ncbi:NmrA family NAD(P)-binding protein [Neorhizobium sp. BT27B]|uniref:NmrA family NAD(P)-binding protein n=1 Tax=Neorhizobium sp. BT27B TaxID=3142625 RepID=UPI003D2D4F06